MTSSTSSVIDWEALNKTVSDPMWTGGAAVCKHTQQSLTKHPNGFSFCSLCGMPISWHKGPNTACVHVPGWLILKEIKK